MEKLAVIFSPIWHRIVHEHSRKAGFIVIHVLGHITNVNVHIEKTGSVDVVALFDPVLKANLQRRESVPSFWNGTHSLTLNMVCVSKK
jgi:hypothetical protein